jgi:hypothetical protein
LAKLLLREEVLRRCVGPTSISENGAETYNCLQNHAFWALRGLNFYFEKRNKNV